MRTILACIYPHNTHPPTHNTVTPSQHSTRGRAQLTHCQNVLKFWAHWRGNCKLGTTYGVVDETIHTPTTPAITHRLTPSYPPSATASCPHSSSKNRLSPKQQPRQTLPPYQTAASIISEPFSDCGSAKQVEKVLHTLFGPKSSPACV